MALAHDPAVVSFGAACPGETLLGHERTRLALTRATQRHRHTLSIYPLGPGDETLRRAVARHALRMGCHIDADDVLITSSCLEAITLCLRAVTQPGDTVALESPTFYGFLQILEELGLRALEIPTHPRTGLSLDALQLALDTQPVKALLAVPTLSNPLGATMPPPERRRLAQMLARHKLPMIEDVLYNDLCEDDDRRRAVQSFDTGGQVMLCGSFSKTIAPGLRLGWIAAPATRAQVHRRREQEPRRKDRAPLDPRDRHDAVFERLAQRLDRCARKLGQLVEEEHSAMGKRRLARPRRRSTANQGGRRHRVVRRAERWYTDEARAGMQQSSDRVDARDLESRRLGKRRQDTWQSPGEHRLADARRPSEQQVVATRRSDLEHPSRPLLAAYVGKVGYRGRWQFLQHRERRWRPLAPQVRDRLGQMTNGDRLDARERDLGCRLSRAHEALSPAASRTLSSDQRTGNRPQPPIEREFPDRRVAVEIGRAHV